ncbi:Centromere/kinetochore Zw10-domain-containing protein [Lactarius pseudohatsudake]|nr:Centromere/kinetochore Zw10-domain-containing protein [Lactarius pseudohatsudake]
MAFPTPSHLPRNATSQDASSQILSKISSASAKSLNAEVAASWVAELDQAILDHVLTLPQAKIHERINAGLPLFEQQFASSEAVQERFAALRANVDELNDAVSHSELGIIPTVVRALSTHAALAQQTQDTEITLDAMECLLRCREEFDYLVSLANEGKLTEAVRASTRLQNLLDTAPPALKEAEVLSSLKTAFRAARDRIEEQLTDAYSRSVVLSPRELTIRPTVQVRDSDTVLDLTAILSSCSTTSLSGHLTVLRRDIDAYYIRHLLTQPVSLTHSFAKDTSGVLSHKLSLLSFQSSPEDLSTRLENLMSLLDFLDTHLFVVLPSPHATNFKKTLCKPVNSALLQQFLVSHLPSSLSTMPQYLRLLKQAETLEEKYTIGMLGQDPRDCEVKSWTDSVSSHYERKRRAHILEGARQMILQEGDRAQIRVEADLPSAPPPPNSAQATQGSGSSSEGAWDVSDDAWGLEGEESGDTDNLGSAAEEEDAWGFDDAPAERNPAELEAPPGPSLSKGTIAEPESVPHTDDSAWGWDDNDDNVDEATSPRASSSGNSADLDDDPWGESPKSSPERRTFVSTHKPASRLEKLANKAKAKATLPQSTGSPMVAARHPPPALAKPIEPAVIGVKGKEPLRLVHRIETYTVSNRTQELADMVDTILQEGAEFASTTIFGLGASATQSRGSVILQTGPAVFDLFRALYTAKFDQQPSEIKTMVFANDCVYACGRVLRAAEKCPSSVKDGLLETADSLDSLGRKWFERSVEIQQDSVASHLKRAEGFVGTADQERFDECEEAVMSILSQVRKVAKHWAGVLGKTKYFDALGSLVNFSLMRILGDILALPDITEVESHRLSELCRILHALEGLFIDDPEQPSFVVACVPAWLKFSYLSELLEASMTDISYLFDEGALIDYETEELVKLVHALFADKPQRANLVNKLVAGHTHSP